MIGNPTDATADIISVNPGIFNYSPFFIYYCDVLNFKKVCNNYYIYILHDIMHFVKW